MNAPARDPPRAQRDAIIPGSGVLAQPERTHQVYALGLVHFDYRGLML